jgi:GTP-binding protein
MDIRSAKFIKGVVGPEEVLEDEKPQIAFIGRSNVGKSSVINSLTKQKGLARTSSFPGLTQQINVFLINNTFYLVDLPGYGYARISAKVGDQLSRLINWYLFESGYKQQIIVLIIDANVGPTVNDLDMLQNLEEQEKNIIVVANKIDKIKKSEYKKQLQKIQSLIGDHKIIPYSSEKRIGVKELLLEISKR